MPPDATRVLGSPHRRYPLPRNFDSFIRDLERETRRAGPAAVATAEALKAQLALAANFILLRKQRGITPRQLSTRTGIQKSEISRIEGGRANPTVATLTALARALGGELRVLPARVAWPGVTCRLRPPQGRPCSPGGLHRCNVTCWRETELARREDVAQGLATNSLHGQLNGCEGSAGPVALAVEIMDLPFV